MMAEDDDEVKDVFVMRLLIYIHIIIISNLGLASVDYVMLTSYAACCQFIERTRTLV
jgi:hypothetical protein